MQKELLDSYRKIREHIGNGPSWAIRKNDGSDEQVIATIPFVGEHYAEEECKILIYASAEMLTGYQYETYLDDDMVACNRHRYFFEQSLKEGCMDHFPNVHLGPVNNGGLSVIAAYIYERITGKSCGQNPCDFYERMAFGNFSKFTMISENGRNIDSADQKDKLSYSEPYVAEDLRILSPDMLIIPKTIYQNEQVWIDSHKGTARVIPIYQIFPRTINRLIKDQYEKGGYDTLSKSLRCWYDMLKHPNTGYSKNRICGKTWENFKSIFAYIDEILEKYNI